MGLILQSKFKLIKHDTIRLSLLSCYEFGIPFGGQGCAQLLDIAQHGHTVRGRFDRCRTNLDVFGWIDQILPLDIVRTDLYMCV